MVFSSVPLYLDPPNWQQLSNQQQLQGHHEQNQHHLMSPQQQQQQTPQPQPNQMGIISGGGGNMGPQAQQIRANSMSERARLAKIPPPEVPQKCPRCDSTNTKFCYYNNYSLSQPRHFCKTCRRYWTRGGALRNVPVGGGCRRNKRSSSSKSSSSGGAATSSKSTTSMVMDQLGNNSDPRGINVNSLNGVGNSSSMSFMASLQNIAQLGGMSNMGLNFGGVNSNSTPLGVGGNYSNNHHNNNLEFPQQQVVQFPNFLGGFEIPSHQFQNLIHNHHNNQGVGGVVNEDHQDQQEGQMNVVSNMSKGSNSSVISSVKMEENGQLGRINIAKQLMMGISSSNDGNNNNVRGNDNQFWGGHGNMTNNVGGVTSMWTDLSGLSSSSTSQLL